MNWTLIKIIGDIVIILLSSLAALAFAGIVLLLAGICVSWHDARRQRRQLDLYGGMYASLMRHALRLAEELVHAS
jgi:hypothetical protein